MTVEKVKVRTKKKASKNGHAANGMSRPSKEDLNDLTIPTEANEPPSYLHEYVMLILGEKGIGKSTLASKFNDPLFFMWEPRRRNLKIRQIPDYSKDEPQLNWSRYRAYIKKIVALPSSQRPQTAVTDTIDRAYNACFRHVCKQNGVLYPTDANDFGRTWNMIAEEFDQVMDSLLFAGIGIIYTSHAKLHTIETATGEHQQWGPSCKDRCWDYLKAVVDCAFFYGYTGRTQRTLTLRGSANIWAACGIEDAFLTPEGVPLRTLALPDDPQGAYDTLQSAYANEQSEYIKPTVKKKRKE